MTIAVGVTTIGQIVEDLFCRWRSVTTIDQVEQESMTIAVGVTSIGQIVQDLMTQQQIQTSLILFGRWFSSKLCAKE